MAPSPAPLEIRLLGGFACSVHGSPATGVNYDKMRALLAYLAVGQGRDHQREALAELLWSGNDPVTARGNLRRTLSDLRRVLESPAGPPLFEASRNSLRLLAPARVDVHLFLAPAPAAMAPHAHHTRLTQLYAGEFMAGFHLPDSPEFDHWLQVQRQTLHRRALALLEQLSNFHEPLGDYDRALPFALRQLELEPWDESAHRRVIRLHALAGQVGAALSQFDACCRVLQQELGIAPGPETQQLVKQIRARQDSPAQQAAIAPASGSAAAAATAARRPITVLFCALRPDNLHDPDDIAERLAAPRARWIGILQGYSGHLVPLPGGGLLAYFGYPLAQELSAVHAVHAALALLQEPAEGIGMRVGIHAGVAVTGSDLRHPDPVGTLSAIAMRLPDGTGNRSVVISHDAHALVAGYFHCTSLGTQSMPELPRPQEVFRVDGATGARTRLDAAADLSPLVGRQAQLARLQAIWQRARHGATQVVLLHGEAGIGKSRLVHAFRQQIARQPHVVRVLHCSAESAQSPWQPVLALLATQLGFAAGDSPQARTRKLAEHVAAANPAGAQEAVGLLRELYALPPADSNPPPAAANALHRHKVTMLLGALLLQPAGGMPLVLVAEDLHWADASTLELLHSLAGPLARGALMAIFTARPGFALPFPVQALALGPLSGPEMEQLVARARPDLPGTALRRIVARADGVPLYAEELAKTARQQDGTQIPGTLHEMLSARVDRLGGARRSAQIAATIGREFGLELLRRVLPADSPALEDALHRLQDEGLVERVDASGGLFRHALIQEATYQSQTRAERQEAHRRIASVLDQHYPELVASQPELLARHQAGGGDIRQAIASWARAGQRAIHASAHQEAMAHFQAALDLLSTLPAAPDRDQTECALLLGLGPALHATEGYGSEEATLVAQRISALHHGLADHTARFQAEWARLRTTLAARGPRGVPQAAAQLLQLAGEDPVSQQAAHYVAAVATFWLGEFEASRSHAARALTLYGPQHHALMLERFGEDLSVSYAGHLSWALCFLGQPDEAQAVRARMFQQARAMQHPKTLAMALLFATMLSRWLNQHAQTLSLSTECLALTRQHGMVHWAVTSAAMQGWAEVLHAGGQDLTELVANALASNEQSPAYAALRLVGLAEVHMHLGRYDEALEWLSQAQASEADSGCLQYAAETCRLQGECLLARMPPDPAAAGSALRRALAISQQQGARMLELRAAGNLARHPGVGSASAQS